MDKMFSMKEEHTPELVAEFCKVAYKKPIVGGLANCFLGCALIVLYMFIIKPKVEVLSAFFYGLGAFEIFFGLYLAFTFKKVAKKQAETLIAATDDQEATITFHDGIIETKSQNSFRNYMADTVYQAIEYEKFWILYIGNKKAPMLLMIGKTLLDDAGKEELKETLIDVLYGKMVKPLKK